MANEALTVSAALRGLAQSCKTVRSSLVQLRARLPATTTAAEATLEELASLDMALPLLSKHVDNDQCIRHITIDEFTVVLAATAKHMSLLESYCEDLISASDESARQFQKSILEYCDTAMRRRAAALQPLKMAILLTLQLMTASPNEPAPVLDRKRQSLALRVQDILASDSILAGRVSTELAISKEPIVLESSSDLSEVGQPQPSVSSSTASNTTKSSWRSLLRRTFSSSRRSSAPSLRSLSTISKWSGSCSSGASTRSVATSQTSISINAPAGAARLPLTADELANGHHYLVKAESAHDVRDFAAQSSGNGRIATYESYAEVSKLLPSGRKKKVNGSPPATLQLQCAKNRSRLRM